MALLASCLIFLFNHRRICCTYQLSSPPRLSSNICSTYAFDSSSVISPAPSLEIHQATASLTSRGIALDDLFYPQYTAEVTVSNLSSELLLHSWLRKRNSPRDEQPSLLIYDPLFYILFIPFYQMLHVNSFFLVSTRRDLDFDTLFAVHIPFGFEKIICGGRSTAKVKGRIYLKRRNRRNGFDSVRGILLSWKWEKTRALTFGSTLSDSDLYESPHRRNTRPRTDKDDRYFRVLRKEQSWWSDVYWDARTCIQRTH